MSYKLSNKNPSLNHLNLIIATLTLINFITLIKIQAAPKCSDIYLPGLLSEIIDANFQSIFIWNDIQVHQGSVREQILSNKVQLILFDRTLSSSEQKNTYPQYPLHLVETRPIKDQDFISDHTLDKSSNKNHNLNAYYNDLARLIYKPFIFTEKYSDFTFYSNHNSFKNKFDNIGFQLQQFDSFLKEIKVYPPPETHIFFETKTKSTFDAGPISFPFKIWSPLRGESYSSIIMRPFTKLDGIVTNPSVIFHERVHTALRYQFGPNSFFMTKQTISLQEGLADFLTSHYLNKAIIGSDFYLIRDIEKTITRMDFKENSPHYNSVIYSNTLWRVRNVVPKDDFNQLLIQFLNQLASREPVRENSKTNSHLLVIENENFRFFLGLLRETFRDNKEATHLINQVANSNLFTPLYLDANLKNSQTIQLSAEPYISPINTLDMTISTLKKVTLPIATAYLIFYFYEEE